MKLVIDIDGTICTHAKYYSDAKPYPERIKLINSLHDRGYEIVFFTARGSGTDIYWRDLTER